MSRNTYMGKTFAGIAAQILFVVTFSARCAHVRIQKRACSTWWMALAQQTTNIKSISKEEDAFFASLAKCNEKETKNNEKKNSNAYILKTKSF